MVRAAGKASLVLFLLCLAPPAWGQFIAVAAGGVFSQDRSAAAPSGRVGGPALSDFSRAGIITVDAGASVFPFVTAGVHYSFSRPELFLRRGDAFGSSALVDLGTHTVTFDARVRTPQAFGFRVYGLAGGGFSRFNLDIKRQVEVPFPSGAPRSLTSPVFTFGGGVEQSVLPLVRLKLEVRDYLTPISERLFQPGGAWHRVVMVGGLVVGR